MDLLDRLDLSHQWVKQRLTESPDLEHFRASVPVDPAADYTASSAYGEQDNARDYPGKSGSIDLPSVPNGLAAAYFNGEFVAVGDWATGLENGDTGKWSTEEATKDMGTTPGMDILATIQKQASFGLPTTEAQQTVRLNNWSHAQTEPFLDTSPTSYADSPFTPDEFQVKISSDYREGSSASGSSYDFEKGEKRCAESDHGSVSSERHEENGYELIDADPKVCVENHEPFSPPFARSEGEEFLAEEEAEELTEDGVRHRLGKLLREAGEDAVQEAVEELFIEDE